MGSKRRAGRRLRIHRETLRSLSDRALVEVGGGTVVLIGRLDSLDAILPKSNAWTGTQPIGICNS
jgi:hypothetical protein